MSVVPSVIVDKDRPISHTGNLIAVVPPGHDVGVGFRVLFQPVVGLSVVIDDHTASVLHFVGHDDRG